MSNDKPTINNSGSNTNSNAAQESVPSIDQVIQDEDKFKITNENTTSLLSNNSLFPKKD